MFKLSPFKKKLPAPAVLPLEPGYTLEPVVQAYEADLTYRRMKVHTATQLLITDRKDIKVGDIMVSYHDGRTEVLTQAELEKRQKAGTL